VAKIKVGHPWMDELSIRFSGVCRPGLPTTAGQAGTRPAAQPVPPAPDGGKQGGQ
jgi:hypothetical protein